MRKRKPVALHHPPGLALEGGIHVGPGGLQRGHQAEDDAGQEREDHGEGGHARIGIGGEHPRGVASRFGGQEQVGRPGGHEEGEAAAQEREGHALHQELADQAAAARAHGQPHRHLALARLGPGQQQVGHVRAGDEQHQADHAHEHEQRGLRLPAQLGGAARSGQEHQGLLRELLLEPLGARGDLGQLLLQDLLVEDVDARLRLLEGEARLQAGHGGEPHDPPLAEHLAAPVGHQGLLHGEGHEEVDGVADLDAVEAGRGHADHGHRPAVDGHGLVDDRGVSPEPALPEAVAQHHEGMGPRRAVVFRR